jgi:hypothetical protein
MYNSIFREILDKITVKWESWKEEHLWNKRKYIKFILKIMIDQNKLIENMKDKIRLLPDSTTK